MNKKIVMTGATGFIGKRIVNEVCKRGAYVKIISTHPERVKTLFDKHYALEAFKLSEYDNPIKLKDVVEDCDAVINLAGANLGDKRWTKKYKQKIYDSRINTTNTLVEAIRYCDKKPERLINASAVGIYGFRDDEALNEDSSLGNDFLAKICRDWETEAMKAIEFNLRIVAIRAGIVLDRDEGALPKLIHPFKFFIGGHQGSGKQWLSWIHIDDLISLYIFAIENKKLLGAVNGTSPDAATNKKFAKTIGKVMHRPSIFKIPGFVLRIAIGEFAKNLVTGQRVYPKKAIESGFNFKFPDLKEALENILKKN